MRIVIEPGHDGVYDPGAVVEGVREADIVREVARRLAALSGDGLTYELKRRPPRAGGLAVLRATLARNPPDVIVSLHCDSSKEDPHRHLARVYYWPELAGSAALAESIAEAATGESGFAEHAATVRAPWDRNGKPYTYPLLRLGRRASVLVELGYLSDRHTRARMPDPAWQRRAAVRIDKATRRWAGLPRAGGAAPTASSQEERA